MLKERSRLPYGRNTTDLMVRYPHLYPILETVEEFEPRWFEEQAYDEAIGPRDKTHRQHRYGLSLSEAAQIQKRVLAELGRKS